MPSSSGHFRVDQVDDITIVEFTDREIVEESTVREIGEALKDLVDRGGRRKLLLNFSNVHTFSTSCLAQLLDLHQRIGRAQGQLKLCDIRPEIMDLFHITQLTKILVIHPTEGEALDHF